MIFTPIITLSNVKPTLPYNSYINKPNKMISNLKDNNPIKQKSTLCQDCFESPINTNNIEKNLVQKVFGDKYKTPLLIGHRGFSSEYPENTLLSFNKAIESGADMIEYDIQLSKDGHVVVFHDSDLKRLTGEDGKISDYTLKELKNFNVLPQEKIPTLNEVIDQCKSKILMNIEIKIPKEDRDSITKKLAQLIKKNKLHSSTIISSFDFEALQKLRQLDKDIKIAVLLNDKNTLDDDFIAKCKSIDAVSINPEVHSLTKDNLDKCHEAGLLVLTWNKNPEKDLELVDNALKNGCDGIFTDYINDLKKLDVYQ